LTLRKYVYYLRGAIGSPRPREPYVRVDEDTQKDLKDLLRRLLLMELD
jgi:dihydrodipicolinate synthase/N-acetylneuraminate lyase